MPEPDDIPPELRAFVAEKIRSVAQLELLLLLHHEPKQAWSAQSAGKALYTAAEMTAELLSELSVQGLLAVSPGPTPSYSYAPRTRELGELTEQLALLYHRRRVAVITLIYAKPVDKLRSFADAFRLRRDEKEGI